MTPEEAQREGEAFEGAAADRRARELSRISRRAQARGRARRARRRRAARPALARPPRERVQQLAKLGVGVVLLDECHHLASLWGYVVRAVLGELAEGVHVIGLTATPPVGLPEAEAELYDALLGPVDFTVPTPAVVRDGHLAPYQELAWLTEPLSAERDWLAEHDSRFRELVTALHDDAESDISFPRWVDLAAARPPRSADDDAEVPWEAFQKRSPKLARAGVRFLLSGGLELPTGAPRGEAYRQPPDLDDWLVLLEDYALRCLAPQQRARGRRALRRDRRRAARARLPAHPQGHPPRHVRGRPAADRLAGQGARAGRGARRRGRHPRRGAARARAVRRRARRPAPRRRAHRRARPRRRHRPPRAAGDRRRRPHRAAAARCWSPAAACAARRRTPTSCWRRCAPPPRIASRCPSGRPSSTACSSRCSPQGAEWMPRAWVELATRAAGRGHHERARRHARAARRGLELPAAERAGRHDDRHHRRLASSRCAAARCGWTRPTRRRSPPTGTSSASRPTSCAAPPTTSASCASTCTCSRPPRTARSRPARRTCTRSSGPFAPPPVERFAALNAELLARAADRDAARERWQIGTPYRGVELPTLLVRRPAARERADAGGSSAARPRRCTSPSGSRSPAALGGAAAFGALGVATERAAAAGRARARPRRARPGPPCACARAKKRLPLVLPLDAAARAVAEAYRELGELSRGGRRLADDRAARRRLPALRAERGHAGRGQAVRGRARRAGRRLRRAALPRLAPARRSAPRRARPARARADAARRRSTSACTPCPTDLARNKERAEAFARAWRRHVGPGPARLHAAHARKAARRAPRRRPPTAATRRWSGTSGSEPSASWAASSRSWAAR